MQQHPLTPEAQRLLKIILDRKIVRGAELMRFGGFKMPTEMEAPLQELSNRHLIEVSGSLTVDALPFATFGTKPSAFEYLRSLVSPS